MPRHVLIPRLSNKLRQVQDSILPRTPLYPSIGFKVQPRYRSLFLRLTFGRVELDPGQSDRRGGKSLDVGVERFRREVPDRKIIRARIYTVLSKR